MSWFVMTAVVKLWVLPTSLVLGVLACGPSRAGGNTNTGTTTQTETQPSTTEVEPSTESEDTAEVETSDATTDETDLVPTFDLPPEPIDARANARPTW